MCPWLFSQTPRSHRRLNPSPCYQPLCPRHLEMCPIGFEEWRYLYETRPKNGVPGMLLRLAVAAANVAVELYDKHPERTS